VPDAGKHSDGAGVGCGIVGGQLQRLPCTFQKQALPWVGALGLVLRIIKKPRIEAINSLDNSPSARVWLPQQFRIDAG
jgi:hypothetical protein